MMTRARMIIVSLLLVCTGLFGNPGSARASELGCAGTVSYYISPISVDVIYFDTAGITSTMRVTRVVMNTMYAKCSYGRDKIKAKWHEACYTHIIRPNGWNFTGVTVQETMWTPENGHSVTPAVFKIPDDGTVQNCKRVDIPLDQEAWLFLRTLDGSPNARHRMHRITVNMFWDTDVQTSSGAVLFTPPTDWKVG